MAQSQTLSALRSRVRRLADVRGASATARYPDADVDDSISMGLADLQRLIMEATPEARNVTYVDVAVTSASATYFLPPSLVRLLTVECLENGWKRLLPRVDLEARARLTDPNLIVTGTPTGFILEGDRIGLVPAPSGPYSLRLWYIPEVAAPSSASDTVDFDLRLDEYVCLYAARDLTTGDARGDLYALLGQRLQEVAGHVIAWARSRGGGVSRVRDEREYPSSRVWGRPWRR